MNNVTATNNTADKGGVVFAEKKAHFEISDSTFESNTAEEGSAIYMIASKGQTSFTERCTFKSNIGSGAIFLLEGQIRISSCTIDSNELGISGTGSPSIYALLSTVTSESNIISNM